ncbi:sensor histidine kinase [Paenibacillus gansuensis]|uniref:Sensor histidine kinase n=1 Tax=Paenibacillus gansuensis TaxID=306542 RepID=A0ABW5PHM1_9BACL
MGFKITIFTKVIVMILVLLVPILCLYGYSHKVSVEVVQEEIETSSVNKLMFLVKQVENSMDQLSSSSLLLIEDPDVRVFQTMYLNNKLLDLDTITVMNRLKDKLSMVSSSSNWSNTMSVYSTSVKQVISTDSRVKFDPDYIRKYTKPDWELQTEKRNGASKYAFAWHTAEPVSSFTRPEQTKFVFEVKFPEENLVRILDQFKEGGNGDPFFFHPQAGVISNSAAKAGLIRKVSSKWKEDHNQTSGKQVMTLDGRQYLVSFVMSEKLGWYLVDYVPLQEILTPITKSKNLFIYSTILLLTLSVLASFLLYSQVQVPIRSLMRGVQQLKKGNYAIRIRTRHGNEFGFLVERFNELAEQIQELIEKVYEEKIRSREAVLKQLQSQINPHFLYNCLAYINSMAKLNQNSAISAMAHHLGKYYRYTTRLEKEEAHLDEELQLVLNYLEIQKLRMPRIQYTLELPDDMRSLLIPRLLIQPLVENAVIHGIEPNPAGGRIRILGSSDAHEYTLIVEDDGIGLSPEQLYRLKSKLNRPLDDHMGCGVWNVHQRLLYRYGAPSGLEFEHSSLGGLKTTIRWNRDPACEMIRMEEVV